MNETDEFEDFDDPMSDIHVKVIFTIIFLLVFIVAFFGNLFVLILFAKCRELRRKTNFLIANLIIADFILSFCCILPRMLEIIYDMALNGYMCKFSHFTQRVMQRVSILVLVAISIERYIVILKPMRSFNSNIIRLRCVIICIWVFSIVYNSVYVVYYDIHQHPVLGYGYGFCDVDWSWYEYYEYTNICLFFIIPSILMVYIHTRIILRVKRPDKILRENYSVKNCVVSVKKKKVIPTDRIKRSKSLLIFNHYKNIDCILGKKLNRKTHSLTTGLVENNPLDQSDDQTLNEDQKFPTEIRILPKTKNRLRKIIRLLILISFCFVFNSLQFVITVLYAKLSSGDRKSVV